MRRIQLYVEDELWSVLRLKARQDRTTISELRRDSRTKRRFFGEQTLQ